MGIDGLYKAFSVGVNAETKVEEFFKKLEKLNINVEELRSVLLDSNDKRLCLSGAGSGKTTGLSLKILFDFYTGDGASKILVTTFIKSGAEDLKKEIMGWARKLEINLPTSCYTVKTIHAECYESLKHIGVPINLIDTQAQMKIAGVIVKKFNLRPQKWATEFTVRQDILGYLTYALNRLDVSRYTHPIVDLYNLSPNMVNAMLEIYKEEKAILKAMDFEDLMSLLLQGANANENILNYLENKYDVIYVDEFQDVSQLQYALLKNYFRYSKVFCVGDDDQSIYSWRGSDVNILNTFQKDYNASLSVLGYNYRCVQGILSPVLASIEKNSTRIPKDLKAFNKAKGEIVIKDFDDADEILLDIKKDIRSGTVGVLNRTNTLSTIFALNICRHNFINEDKDAIKVKLSGSDLNLIKKVFALIDLTKPVWTSGFDVACSLLFKPYLKNEVKGLSVALKVNNLNLSNIPLKDVEISFPNLYSFVEGYQCLEADNQDDLDLLRLEYVLSYFTFELSGDSNYVLYMKLIGKTLLKLLKAGVEYRNWDTFKDYFVGFIIEASNFKGKADVDITTAHDAKGKEWDSVYLAYNIKGVYPLENSTIVSDPAYIAEERRLHYIAWTRAKNKLTILTKPHIKSKFLQEVDLNRYYDYAGVDSPSEVVSKVSLIPDKEVRVQSVVSEESQLRDFILTASTVYDDDPILPMVLSVLDSNSHATEIKILKDRFNETDLSEILIMQNVNDIVEVILNGNSASFA
jgi:DNA helicase-2/ATP-dependent DNA helicase PcrA